MPHRARSATIGEAWLCFRSGSLADDWARLHNPEIPQVPNSAAAYQIVPEALGSRATVPELDLRNDVYRRPLQTALERLGLGPGWRCADIGAGGGDVTVALARLVGAQGRVYAVDIDPARRDEVAEAAAEVRGAQVVVITQAAEDLVLPEEVDLAYCRFLLMHVLDPLAVLRRMASVTRRSGWLVAQEPVTTAGRVAGTAMSMPSARHPDVGALLPALVKAAGLQLVDSWAEAQAGAGPGPVARYLEDLSGADPGDDPVVLPPLVTVLARRG